VSTITFTNGVPMEPGSGLIGRGCMKLAGNEDARRIQAVD
jgi:hypothetical protein